MDYDLLYRSIGGGILDGFDALGVKAEAIGEAFGRGWRRANPPAGLVGRRCRWTEVDEVRTGTIRYVGGDGALLV